MSKDTATIAAPIEAAVTTEPLRLIGGSYSVPALNQRINDANSRVKRLPLLPGEDKSKYTSKGLSVRRLDAYDWERVLSERGPDAVSVGKSDVRILVWALAGQVLFDKMGNLGA